MIADPSIDAAKICIGIVSRERPKMVDDLLNSIAKLKRSNAFSFEIVLVENGPKVVLSAVIEEFKTRAPYITLHYIHEPKIGVVYARNAALDFADKLGFDKLAFVDDDEVVDPEWLANLHTAQSEQNLDLIGGPVRPFVRSSPNRFLERLMWKSYQCRSRRVERVSNTRNARGNAGKITLATNNWMLDLRHWREKSLRFDMQYNLSGGEDTAFYASLKQAGAKTGWARNAIVHEEIPIERLTIKYQFTRSRDQSLVSFHRKYDHRPIKRWLTVPLGALYKFVAAMVMFVMTPFTMGDTWLSAIRALGASVGRLAGLMGRSTQHYAKTTGR